jgi:putative transposase
MPFWKCYYHAVWSTAQRQSLLTPQIETVVIETIKRKSNALDCPILAINGTTDHIHIAVSITPGVSVAEWVRSVKGLSTHEINALFPDLSTPFKWQKSYGVLTYGEKLLPFVVAYVENQKQHHANNSTQPYLELMDSDE